MKKYTPDQFIDAMEGEGFHLSAGVTDRNDWSGKLTWVAPLHKPNPAKLKKIQSALNRDFSESELAAALIAAGRVTNDGWARKYLNLDTRVVASIADRLGLTPATSETLAFRLHKARSAFDSNRGLESSPTYKQAAEFLGEIKASLRKINQEAKPSRRAFRRAKSELMSELNVWASDQDYDTLHDLGFEKTPTAGGDTDYGSYVVLERWFALLPIIFGSLCKTKRRLEGNDSRARDAGMHEFLKGDKAKRHLVGTVLPRLYTEVTASKFTTARKGPGIRFVMDSHRAMKLGVIGVDGVLSHCKRPRTTRAGVKAQ